MVRYECEIPKEKIKKKIGFLTLWGIIASQKKSSARGAVAAEGSGGSSSGSRPGKPLQAEEGE